MEKLKMEYGLSNETVTVIIVLQKHKSNGSLTLWDSDFFNFVVGVSQVDTFGPYLVIICLVYEQRTMIDQINWNGFSLRKRLEGDDIPQ